MERNQHWTTCGFIPPPRPVHAVDVFFFLFFIASNHCNHKRMSCSHWLWTQRSIMMNWSLSSSRQCADTWSTFVISRAPKLEVIEFPLSHRFGTELSQCARWQCGRPADQMGSPWFPNFKIWEMINPPYLSWRLCATNAINFKRPVVSFCHRTAHATERCWHLITVIAKRMSYVCVCAMSSKINSSQANHCVPLQM